MIFPVYLVGAGPGDPGLITVSGQRALDSAEVVIADRLVAPSLLPSRDGVEVIVRGERRSALPQEEINRLLVERARAGKRVVRLKGGDPFVFGRGGEEAEALRAAGIPFVVVPGVTAAIAAPAYAGIPVTHRHVAGAVAFVTGHEADDKDTGHVNWEALATGATTLVLYMSVSHLDTVARRIVAAGRAPSTPVAVIERGTTPRQRVVVGTLADIADKAREAKIEPPAMTIVGEVVALRDHLAWSERSPLRGRTVLCLSTRAVDDDSHAGDEGSAFDALAAEGLSLEWVSPLAVDLRADLLAEPLGRLDRFRWIAFTSPHAVGAFARALGEARLDSRSLAGLSFACLDRVATSLRQLLRVHADLAVEGGGAALAQALIERDPRGPVLFPRALDGRDELPSLLRAAGLDVQVVDAYETVPARGALAHVVEQHRRSAFDAVAFGSPRGAASLLDAGFAPDGALVGAIGETTAAALQSRGITVDVVASKPSYAVLVTELGAALARAHQIG